MDHTVPSCAPDRPVTPEAIPQEPPTCVHRHLLGFYDGVYYWEFECQDCGATLEAMPDP